MNDYRVENAKTMRETAKIEGRISEQEYRTMLEIVKRMAGYLSEAELAKVKNEVLALAGPTASDEDFEL